MCLMAWVICAKPRGSEPCPDGGDYSERTPVRAGFTCAPLQCQDPLVHVCLYFIAPHRLKHIDVAFMRRIHKMVNIVPIIAKSDTMTTKEKEEFKMQASDS